MIVLHKCPVDGGPCDGCAVPREGDDAVDCWLQMSDDEVLARTRLAGENPQEVADRVQAVFLDALRTAHKRFCGVHKPRQGVG